MSTSARADIFARLRGISRASGASSAQRERQALGRAPAAASPDADLHQVFLTNVINNGGTIDAARDRSSVVTSVAEYLFEHFRSQRLVAGSDPRLAALPWRDAGLLPRFGSLEQGEPVALSFAQLAIAETGAVVTWTGKANPAANNFMPEHHIVLVSSADVVPDLEEAWTRTHAEIGNKRRPRGINMIAGPSSTADIGGELVRGAHGPRCLHVILLGDIPADAMAFARSQRSASGHTADSTKITPSDAALRSHEPKNQ